MVSPAIRFVAAKAAKQQGGSIHLLCHVKPGVRANREGIAGVSNDAVEVCVAAQARDGEANKAVREVIAEALKVPKSDVEVARGMKSREKTVVVNNISSKSSTPEQEVERIKIILEESVGR